MSHSIFGTRFVSVREPAWHNLGTVLEDTVTAQEALKIAGLDFQYNKVPLVAHLPNGEEYDTGKFALMREPTHDDSEWRFFGSVSDSYSVLPNEELAQGLDELAAASGWTFETAGALDRGRRVFMTLNTGEYHVKSDHYQSYVVVTDSKGTGESLQVLLAPTRVVCHNTLVMARNSSIFDIRLRHGSSLKQDYSFWMSIVNQLVERERLMVESLNVMANTRIDEEQLATFLDEVFPFPEKSARHLQLESIELKDSSVLDELESGMEYWFERQRNYREATKELYRRFNDSDENQPTNNGGFAETAYAALQAVTEIADWGGRNTKTATQSALFGSRAQMKQKAWAAAEALA